MTPTIWGWLAAGLMGVCLVLVPLGLPGVWLMVALAGVLTLLGHLGVGWLLVLAAIAGASELAELGILRRMSARHGESKLAFWGALAGGLAGVVVGVPIPLIGPVIAGLVGTFLGAAAGALWESRRLMHSTRVAWGTVLGRLAAMGVKGIAGVAIIILTLLHTGGS